MTKLKKENDTMDLVGQYLNLEERKKVESGKKFLSSESLRKLKKIEMTAEELVGDRLLYSKCRVVALMKKTPKGKKIIAYFKDTLHPCLSLGSPHTAESKIQKYLSRNGKRRILFEKKAIYSFSNSNDFYKHEKRKRLPYTIEKITLI